MNIEILRGYNMPFELVKTLSYSIIRSVVREATGLHWTSAPALHVRSRAPKSISFIMSTSI